jgi:uncharacterized RDD family membrane protein YckC
MAAVTETTPPTPPAQPATPGQPAGAPDARPAPGVHLPIPGQPIPPGDYPPPPGYVLVLRGPDGRPLASFADRLVAYILDAVILGGVALIFVVPLLVWWFRTFAETVTTMETSVNRGEDIPADFFTDLFGGYFALFGAILALGLILSYVYLVEMSWRSGQTIGKRVMKLQITPATPGEERSRMMFVRRWAVERVAGSLVPFFSYLDGLWQLWDKPLQQCLHDKAARTVVVKIG